MSFDNSKQVVLSKVVSDNPAAPVMRVNFEVNGQKYQAGLWPWTRKDGSPVTDKAGNALYKGDWDEDNYTAQVQQDGITQAKVAAGHPPAAADPGGFEDDIPFAQFERGTFA